MSVRTNVCEAIVVVSALSVIACGQATSVTAPSSTTPTTPNATITAVVVNGPAASGTNFQLTAAAKTAQGSSQDVTALARWEASDPTKVSISSTGWVTILGLGTVDVRATYQNISGTMQVQVTPPPPDKFNLTGVVREVDPSSHPIAGAIVRISSGADIGMQAVTNAKGEYAITGLSRGFVAVETSADGYSVDSVGMNILGNKNADLWLTPTPPKNPDGDPATARCNDGTWSWAKTRAEACTLNGGVAYPVCPGPMCPDTPTKK